MAEHFLAWYVHELAEHIRRSGKSICGQRTASRPIAVRFQGGAPSVSPSHAKPEIIDANEPYLAATRTRRRELMGHDMFEAFPDNPDVPEAHAVRNLRASLERVLDHGHPDRMPSQRYDIRDRDGKFEERWWEPINIPVFQAGRLVTILHHVVDVTARQRAVNAAAAGWAKLTRRERDVLAGFAKGLTTKQVAAEMALSTKAIEYYRLRLFEKLGVTTQGALIRIGVLASV